MAKKNQYVMLRKIAGDERPVSINKYLNKISLHYLARSFRRKLVSETRFTNQFPPE